MTKGNFVYIPGLNVNKFKDNTHYSMGSAMSNRLGTRFVATPYPTDSEICHNNNGELGYDGIVNYFVNYFLTVNLEGPIYFYGGGLATLYGMGTVQELKKLDNSLDIQGVYWVDPLLDLIPTMFKYSKLFNDPGFVGWLLGYIKKLLVKQAGFKISSGGDTPPQSLFSKIWSIFKLILGIDESEFPAWLVKTGLKNSAQIRQFTNEEVDVPFYLIETVKGHELCNTKLKCDMPYYSRQALGGNGANNIEVIPGQLTDEEVVAFIEQSIKGSLKRL